MYVTAVVCIIIVIFLIHGVYRNHCASVCTLPLLYRAAQKEP